MEVESKFELCESQGVDLHPKDSDANMNTLEIRRRDLLDEKEETWRTKSEAL